MSQGKKKCDICGNGINLKKKDIYLVNKSFFPPLIYDAIDCPFCGCQTLLKIRYSKSTNKENNKEEIKK